MKARAIIVGRGGCGGRSGMGQLRCSWRLADVAFPILGTLCGVSFQSLETAAAEPPPRPDIVFILADDLGWRDLGCYGSSFYRTPNVDRLASRGMRFTQAYAANPLCSPTRASILTGLWPARIGITAPVCHLPTVVLQKGLAAGNPRTRVLVANSVTRLATHYVTLASTLKAAGYRTGHFGKWHLGPEPYSPLQHGFEVDWPHWPGPGPAGSYVAPWRFPPALGVQGRPGDHIEDVTAERVVEFIRQNKDRPFFVNYWTFSVHAPYDGKDALVAKYRECIDPSNPQRNPVYAAMVESLDDNVGRVLAAVDECGLRDRTIVVFFSDNGGVSWPGRGAAGRHPSGRFAADMSAPPTSNLPMRNGKASLYEGGVRVPCIVVWPGVTPPGSVSGEVIQSIDWFPTLLEIAGVPMPSNATPDGISITAALRGGTVSRDAIFCHFPHDTPASGQRPGASVRRGDWKLIRLFAGRDDGRDAFELYNLKNDVGESANVAADHPDLVRELNNLLTKFLKETDAVIPRLNPNFAGAAAAAKSADPLQGWLARGCEVSANNGVLTVVGKSATPFLGVTAGARGPGAVRFRIRAARGGGGRLEWFPPGQPPKGESQSVPFRVEAGEWNEVEVPLSADAAIGILRVYLPARDEPVDLDWIELDAGKKRRWDF